MALLKDNEINLGTLPTDIIRKIISLDQTFEVTEGLRQISPAWNSTVVEYLNNDLNRSKLPTLEHFHWKINCITRKSTLSMTMSKRLQSYFGVQSWHKVRLDTDSEFVKVEEGRQIELLENCDRLEHNISRLFRRCSRIAELEISSPAHLIVSNLAFLATATSGLIVEEFSFTQLENLEGLHYITKPFFSALLPFIRAWPYQRLRFSSNNYDEPHYGHFLKKTLSYVSIIVFECASVEDIRSSKEAKRNQWISYAMSLNTEAIKADFSYDVLENGNERLRITSTAKQ